MKKDTHTLKMLREVICYRTMRCPRWKDQYNYGDSVGLRVMIVPKLKGELHILIFPSILTPESMTRDDFDIPFVNFPLLSVT